MTISKDLKEKIIKHLREESVPDVYKFEGFERDDNEVNWIMFATISEFTEEDRKRCEFDFEEYIEDEGYPTHVARVIIRNASDMGGRYGKRYDDSELEALSLVNGEELYLKVSKEGEYIEDIWVDIWEGSQPSFYGGYIEVAKKWCEELGELDYESIKCPKELSKDISICYPEDQPDEPRLIILTDNNFNVKCINITNDRESENSEDKLLANLFSRKNCIYSTSYSSTNFIEKGIIYKEIQMNEYKTGNILATGKIIIICNYKENSVIDLDSIINFIKEENKKNN